MAGNHVRSVKYVGESTTILGFNVSSRVKEREQGGIEKEGLF